MLLLPWCNLQMKTLRTVMLKEVRNMGHSSCFYFQCDSPTRERWNGHSNTKCTSMLCMSRLIKSLCHWDEPRRCVEIIGRILFFLFVFFAMEFLRHACLTRWYPMSILLLHIHFVLHLAVQCENETEYKCCMATFFLRGDALSVPQGVLQWSGTVLQQHRVPAQLHRSHGKGDARLQTMWVSLFFFLFFSFYLSFHLPLFSFTPMFVV